MLPTKEARVDGQTGIAKKSWPSAIHSMQRGVVDSKQIREGNLVRALGSSLVFLYDGWNLLAEFDAQNANAPVRTYVWGLDLSGSTQGAGGVGGLLCASSGSASYSPLYDGNGNVTGWVSNSDGRKVCDLEYDPFGNPLRVTGTVAAPFGFSTKYSDGETGFCYYGYRYYNPSTGRWPNRDPLEEEGGENLYGFVDNGPIGDVDFLGLALYAFDGTGNTYGQQTHVGILHSIYHGTAEYERGVGTTWSGFFDNPITGGVNGAGGSDRLASMYRKFLIDYKSGDHDIDIIGFSRGAALAREFANMLYERGYEETTSFSGIGRRGTQTTHCPVEIRFVGLFDTVGSFGIPGNDINIGIRMDLPPNVKIAAQALARDEKRQLFPVTRLNKAGSGQAFFEKVFPGDHSDIGGGWGPKQNQLAIAPLEYIWSKGLAASVPFGPLPARRLLPSWTPHDNRGIGVSIVTRIFHPFTSPTQPRKY